MPRRRIHDPGLRDFLRDRELMLYDEGYAAGFRAAYETETGERIRLDKTPLPGIEVKRPRRKTAYQSAYSAAYKRLRKKHPRMAFGSLSKKAHAAARKKVKR